MPKLLKVFLIVTAIIVVIVITINIVGIAMFWYADYNMQKDREDLEQQTIQHVEHYLEAKYPEKSFTILKVVVRETYNGFIQSGWDNVVQVNIAENGKDYIVFVDTSFDKPICFDNIQGEEIMQAITDKLLEISNFEKNIHVETFLEMSNYDYCFNSKYDGDISTLLQKEKKYFDEHCTYLRAIVYYVDGDENFIQDEETIDFLGNFEEVIWLNFDEKLPEKLATFWYAESNVNYYLDKGIPLNAAFNYDHEVQSIIEILKTKHTSY